MNRFFTLLLAASCLTAVGQVTYPYNPDGNADGDIAVGDLQDFLVTYGNPFSPSEIMVGDSSLTYWVEQLSQTVQEQQELINALQASAMRNFDPALGRDYPQGLLNGNFVEIRLGELEEYTVPEGFNLYMIAKTSSEGAGDDDLFNQGFLEGWYQKDGEESIWLGDNIGGLAIGEGATFFFVGYDSLSHVGHLVPDPHGFEILKHDFTLESSYTVPDGKRLFVQDMAYNSPLEEAFTVSDPESFSYFENGIIHEIFTQMTTWPSGTTIALTEWGQNWPGAKYTLSAYLYSNNLFETPLQDPSDEEPAEDNLGPCEGEFTVNYQGYDYELVEIGDQCWFAENCRYLPSVDSYQNAQTEEPQAFVQAFHGSDISLAIQSPFYEAFGAYYNLAAVNTWALCPSGFDVASANDWASLVSFTTFTTLNGLECNSGKLLQRHQGDLLGFDLRQSGKASGENVFNEANYWPSNALIVIDEGQYFQQIEILESGYIFVSIETAEAGLSVRCIKDSE